MANGIKINGGKNLQIQNMLKIIFPSIDFQVPSTSFMFCSLHPPPRDYITLQPQRDYDKHSHIEFTEYGSRREDLDWEQ